MADYRLLQREAEELRVKTQNIIDNCPDGLTKEQRREVMSANNQMEILEERARQAQDDQMREAREIAHNGKTIGEWAGSSTETRAFLDYLKTGYEDRAALVAGTGANGGYIVAEALHAPLIEKARKMSPILNRATVLPIELGNSTIYLPYKAAHGAVATATETGARTEQTEPTFTHGVLTAHDFYSDQRASQQMIDSYPDFEMLLLSWIATDIYEAAGVDFAIGSGDGATGTQGLFAATGVYANVLSGVSGSVVNTNFVTMYTALLPQFRTDAVWLMNSATLGVVGGMVYPGTVATPLVDWSGGVPTILGKEVLETTSAPGIGAAAYPVAFADVRQAYAIAMHRQPMVLRDPYTATPLVRYYGLSRLGGMSWDPQACVLLKSSNV